MADVLRQHDLEPSLVDRSVYATKRRWSAFDFTSVISFLVGALMLIPVPLVIPKLTAVGRPAMLVGLLLAGGWLIGRAHSRLGLKGPQPLRWAAGIYLAAVLASYAAGYLRGLPTIEANAADRAMISTVVFVGVMLAAADGIVSRSRLNGVIKTLVVCGAIMGFIGLIESVTKIKISSYMVIPGLTPASDDFNGAFQERGAGFFRVQSTAAHYIEFSAVMAMTLPFAIHLTRFSPTRLARQIFGICTLLIFMAIPVALSRTGVVALGVGMATLFFAWSWRVRLNMAIAGVLMTLLLAIGKPGILGTLLALFTWWDADPSIATRTQDYSMVTGFFMQRPWLGRGPGTFVPTVYDFLDNEWLMHVVTMGAIGVLALIGMYVTTITLSVIVWRRATSDEDRHLAACLIAIQLIGITVSGTFDTFSFSTYAVTFFLLSGVAGALWRLTHPETDVRTAAARLPGKALSLFTRRGTRAPRDTAVVG
jgi:hypothetical protein